MADGTSVTFSITILPDEIAKTITDLSATYVPADVTEKWYYKNTTVSNTSTDLIAGAYLSEEAIGTAHDTIVAAEDKVKFLYIKNNGSNTVYIVLDAATASSGSADAIVIPNALSWFGLVQCPVASLHAITNTGTSICDVAAIIDDGGV